MMFSLTMPRPILNLCTLLLLGFIWGTGYSIARFAMINQVPALGYSFWESIGPAIIIGSIALTRVHEFQFSLKDLRFYFVCGFIGIAVPNTTMYFAASHVPAGVMAMIVSIVPIIAYPLALLMHVEKFNWQRFIGIMVAFCGLLFILFPNAHTTSISLFWLLITLITPISFAVSSTYIARFAPRDTNILVLTTGMLVFSSLLLLPIIMATQTFYALHFPLLPADWVILLEIVLSSVGYLLFFYLIKTAGPVYYSLVDTIVVLTGIFWGYIIFHEKLNFWTGMAVIFIVSALLIVTRQQRRHETHETCE